MMRATRYVDSDVKTSDSCGNALSPHLSASMMLKTNALVAVSCAAYRIFNGCSGGSGGGNVCNGGFDLAMVNVVGPSSTISSSSIHSADDDAGGGGGLEFEVCNGGNDGDNRVGDMAGDSCGDDSREGDSEL